MVILGIGIFLLAVICLVVCLINPRFRTKKLITAAAAVMLASIIFVGLTKRHQAKAEQKIETEQAAQQAEQKAKEKQASKAKVESEQQAQAEQETQAQADREQKAQAEQASKAQEEQESKVQIEQEQQAQAEQADKISDVQGQLIGKTYVIVPALYDGEDVDQAMSENKAPQNLFHDGAQMITFTDKTAAQVQLNGAYRPDYSTGYTLSENTLTIGQNTIPYTYANGTIAFSMWETTADGHTITWSISPN